MGICLTGLVSLAFLFRSLTQEGLGLDGETIWTMKAKSIERYGTFWNPDFMEPVRPHVHPQYPLLMPCVYAWVFRVTSPSEEIYVRLAMFLFFLASLAVVHGTLSERMGMSVASWCTAGYSLLPTLGNSLDGVLTAYCDYPLAVFAMIGAVRACSWLEGHRGAGALSALACCAAMTKDEGGAIVGLSALVLAVMALRIGSWRKAAGGIAILLPGLALFVLWTITKRGLLQEGPIVRFGSSVDVGHCFKVLLRLTSELCHTRRWNVLWMAIAVLLVTRHPRLKDPSSFLPLLGLCMLGVYLVVWTGTTDRRWMEGNEHRLLLHLGPLCFVWMAWRLGQHLDGLSSTKEGSPSSGEQ